jgi:hypothetical protein
MKSDNSLKVSYSKVLQTSMNVSVSSGSGANMDYHQSQHHHNHHQSATTTPKTSRQITNQGRRSQTNQNLNTYNRQKVIIYFVRIQTN